MSDLEQLADLTIAAAEARNDPAVPRALIMEALRRIQNGQEKVQRYPTGLPSLKDTYDIAARLVNEPSAKV